jgi:hypothetical protein
MSTFHYRRRLEKQEVLQLAAAAAGAGAALAGVIIYLGRIWLQQVPLKPSATRHAAPVGPGPDPILDALAHDEAGLDISVRRITAER